MATKRKKICFISGTRADYGILTPVMKAVQASKNLDLYLIVVGMHLEKEFGSTYKEIAKDGFKIDGKIRLNFKKDDLSEMAQSVGRAIGEFPKVFTKIKPDLVVVLGDRGEMLAAAVAANYLNIPVAHIHGGEKSGHVDGIVRHAITKLSHLHFAATNLARQRIIKMGEEPWRVILAGAPALDTILNQKLPSKIYLLKKYQLKDEPLIIVVQHPVSDDVNQASEQMEATLQAVLTTGSQILVLYPNADAGGKKMIKVIEKYRGNPQIMIIKSLPHKDYLGLLKLADVLVGNSSSGIIEAASFNLPVINVGSRQKNREGGNNIIHTGNLKTEILKALNKAFSQNFLLSLKNLKNPYGQGKASQKIVQVLEKTNFDKLQDKKLNY